MISSICGWNLIGKFPVYNSSTILNKIGTKRGVADMTNCMPDIFLSPSTTEEFFRRLLKTDKTRYKYIQLTIRNCDAYHQLDRLLRAGALIQVAKFGGMPRFLPLNATQDKVLDAQTRIVNPWILIDATSCSGDNPLILWGDDRFDEAGTVRLIDAHLSDHYEECPICLCDLRLDDFSNGDVIYLSCSHCVHFKCFLELWNNENKICPICREPICFKVEEREQEVVVIDGISKQCFTKD